MRYKVIYLFALLLLWGCLSYGRDFATAPVKNIQTKVTTQQEVFGYFGEPVRKGLENGYESWTYFFHRFELGNLTSSKDLYVVFNKDGTVRSYSFTAK